MRCFRSISKDELAKLMLGIPITGKWNKGHHSECGYSGYWGSVVCAFTDEIRWADGDHSFFVELEIPDNRIVERATSIWMMPKTFAKTKTYSGRSGSEQHLLSEVYFKEYDLRDVIKVKHIVAPNRTIAVALDETFRYHTWHCPHFNHLEMRTENYIEEFRKMMDKFPDANTAIPKQEYFDNAMRLLKAMMDS